MEINTCSAAIGFTRKLEEDSAKFYEEVAQRHTKDAEVLLSFAGENKKNIIHVERAYYEVISDAIEGCFAFRLNSDDYTVKTKLAQGATSYAEALQQAVEMEENIIRFYLDAAEQSKSLMADVPRAFTTVAKRRSNRIVRLESLK